MANRLDDATGVAHWRTVLDEVASGGSLIVVVEGDPGTGRTWTLDRFARLASDSGLRVARARAVPQDHEVPYAVVTSLSDDLDAKLAWDATEVAEDVVEVAHRLVEAARPRTGAPGTCLLLDDAGYADLVSLQVLLHVASRLRRGGIALVIACGPDGAGPQTVELLDQFRAMAETAILRIGLFDLEQTRTVVTASLGSDVPADVVAALHDRSAGNAYLLSALLEELDGRVPSPGEVATLVPERIVSAAATRIPRLGAAAVDLARAVQVLGPDATLPLAVELAGVERRDAEDVADRFVRAGTWSAEPAPRFTHPVVADAVGRLIEPFAAGRMHYRVAELLRDSWTSRERVADHLLHATPHAEPWVVEILRETAARRSAEGDLAGAAVLLRRALEEPPGDDDRPTVLAELAFAESRAGVPTADETLELALAAATDPVTRRMLLRERTRVLWLTGRLPDAVDASETALAEAEPDSETHEELLAELLAVASMHDLAPIYARPKLVDLLERANTGWVPDSAPLAATLATVLPFVCGDLRLVGPLVDRALEEDLWRVDAPPFGLRPDFVIGSLWLSAGLERGAAIIRQGMQTVDPDNLFRHGLLWYWLGEITYAAGDLPGTLEATGTALEPRWGPMMSWYGFSSATRAHAFLDLADRRSASAVIDATDGKLDPHQLYGISVDLVRARMLFQDRPGAAYDLAMSVSSRLDSLGHRDSPQIVWRCIAASAALENGHPDRARELLLEELALGESTHAAGRVGRALRNLARITERPERTDVLRRAVAALAPSEHRLELARAALALGIELHETGDVPGARAALAEAREIAAACGANALANRALTALHATGARPRRTARTGVAALTSTERRVADLAAAGRTNREIADLLNIAPRTVEWHLRGAFGKLGIRSRRQLGSALQLHD